MFVSRNVVIYLRKMGWNAANVTEMFSSGKLRGKNATSEMQKDGEKMSYHGTVDVYLMKKIDELIGTGYTSSESFVDLMHFPEKMSEGVRLPTTYERMFLNRFIA